MKTAIISPHTDDALFSLGSYLTSKDSWGEVTIISPFAGIPDDESGKKKHTVLRKEHEAACELAGVKVINGDFFDDVYGPQDKLDLASWFIDLFFGGNYDQIFIPLGIHHPDHVLIRNLILKYFYPMVTGFYEELPYRFLYPELYTQAVQNYTTGMRRKIFNHNAVKELVVSKYASQLGPHMYDQLFIGEGIWIK